MNDLRLPKIDAPTPQGQVIQLKSYLIQLVSDLNYALTQIDNQLAEIKKKTEDNTK